MKTKAALFKTIFFALLIAALSGCNMNFLADLSTATDNCNLRYEWNDPDHTIKSAYNTNNVLVWHEVYTWDGAGFDRPSTIRHYNASDALEFAWAYEYTANNMTMEAYFDGGDNLVWFTVNTYDGSNNLILSANYNAASQLQYAEQTTWSAAGPTQITRVDGSLALEWLVAKTYSASSLCTSEKTYKGSGGVANYLLKELTHDYTGGKETLQEAFGDWSTTVTAAKPLGWSASMSGRGLPAGLPASRSFALPVKPASPVVPAVTPAANPVPYLERVWAREWLYEPNGYGWTSLAYLDDNYPVDITLLDKRLSADRPIDLSITWEGNGAAKRIAKKTTKYGNQVILDLVFGYDASSRLTSVKTSGVAMLVPLDFTISYVRDFVPQTITAWMGGNKLYSLAFDYGDAANTLLKLNTENAASIDPFRFGGKIVAIQNYDGDDKYLGAYTFNYLAGSTEIVSTKADGSYNGKFVLTLDGAARATALTSYSASGDVVWQYKYTLSALISDATKIYRSAEQKLDASGLPVLVKGLDIQTLFH